MTVREIYEGALRLMSEDADDERNDDYAERTPYVMATFCSQVSGTDSVIRKLSGESEANSYSPVYLSLEDEFPLLDVFVAPAMLYLAAMLVIDYDAELYDRFFTRYCDAISQICDTTAGVCEKTSDRYFTEQ